MVSGAPLVPSGPLSLPTGGMEGCSSVKDSGGGGLSAGAVERWGAYLDSVPLCNLFDEMWIMDA